MMAAWHMVGQNIFTFFSRTPAGGAIRRARFVYLFSVSHEQFSKIWYLFLICPFLSIFNWKSNTILHHKVRPMFYILAWKFEWMNTPWFYIILCVSNGTPSYFPWFIKKGLKIPQDVNRRRTDNQMAKWKRTKWQTMMWNTLRRKLNIE